MIPIPSRSIRGKFLLAFVGLAAVPMALLGWWGIRRLTDALTERALAQVSFEVASNAIRIEDFLSNVQRDVLYLARSSAVRNLTDSIDSPGRRMEYERRRKELSDELLQFLGGRQAYYEVCYSDEQGREHVKLVDDATGDLVIVPEDQLQDDGQHYDFQYATKLPPGEIYVSPMDFDVQPGPIESESLFKPVVGYATPVMDSAGQRRGILLIKVFATHLVQLVDYQGPQGESFLLNSNGDYLYSAKSGQDGGFHNPDHPGNVSDNFRPEMVDELLSKKADAVLQPAGGILAHASVPLLETNPERFWILGTSIPGEVVLRPIERTRTFFFIILFSVIVAAAGIAVSAARRLHRPILALRDGARMISEGNFDHRIRLKTHDEIEDLGNQFNLMAEQVGQAIRKMEQWNDDLQKEVARQTAQLRNSEEQLRIENRKLDDIVTSIGAEIFLLDSSRKILWANKRYLENRTGSPYVLGQSCVDLCGARGNPCEPCPALQTFQNGQMQSIVRESAEANRCYQVITTPVTDESGGVFQVLELWLDITESVERERAIRQQAAENEKLAALVQLSAGVVHEVANPLAAIRTTIDVMEKEMPTSNSQRFEAIRRKIDDLGQFLRTFSLFARPGKPQLQASDVLPILRSVVQLLEHEANRRGVAIREQYATDILPVQANPMQLQQVFINLLLNAFDAMPEGGQVSISAEANSDGTLSVSIADTGIGIPAAQLVRIFEPFFTTKPSGTGLGLAIVQQIVKAHGAELKVHSSPTTGTTFTIRFPATITMRTVQ